MPSENTILKLYPLGDLHLGANNVDWDAFVKVRDMIAKDPNAYWLGMGDLADSITPNDKRWDSRVTDWKRLKKGDDADHDDTNLSNEQGELVDSALGPIWHKCIGLLKGNHEETVERMHYVNIIRWLCHKHDLAYLHYSALIRLEIAVAKKVVLVDIFAEHGGAGGGTDGNAVNNHSKRLDDFEFDIALKGHVHKRWISRRTVTRWGPTRPLKRTRLLVGSGTFLKGYEQGFTAYPERKGLAPNEIGSCVVLIRPRAHAYAGRDVLIDAVYTEAMEMLS